MLDKKKVYEVHVNHMKEYLEILNKRPRIVYNGEKYMFLFNKLIEWDKYFIEELNKV